MGTLTKKFLNDMISNYRNNQLNAINSNLSNLFTPEGDTHAVRFDLEKLKSFINDLETLGNKVGVESKDLGIRFYLGAYPSKNKWDNYEDLDQFDHSDAYANMTTLILIPTKKVGNKDLNYDFENNKPIRLDVDTINRSLSEVSQDKNAVFALNHGNAIPPY